MTLLKSPSAADRRAAELWRANRDALASTQPDLELGDDAPPEMEWLFGRDGSLTARDPLGQWWAGCSLPRRAGAAMLRKLDVRGVTACLLAPTYAGQVTAALAKLQPQQAVIVIQPDLAEARLILCCADFADDLRLHRLWLTVGPDWPAQLRQVFADQPGLPTPSQFIRLPIAVDDVVTPIIRTAEAIFNEVNAARTQQLNHLALRGGERLLVVAGSRFRLWDDAGDALVRALGSETNVATLDPDDPAQSSSLALALAAQDCRALIIPDRFRADLPPVLPRDVRVVTWLTHPRLPAYNPDHPNDALLLADENWTALAKSAGWPASSLAVAHWPSLELPTSAEPSLGLICDTAPLDTPTQELELSSHHVLWEMIRADVLADPFALRDDVVSFIDRRRAKLGISDEGFNRDLFIARLVVPAYQQAIATRLLQADLPLRIYGRGWDALSPQFAAIHQGPIHTRDQFLCAAGSATALVYPCPLRQRHAIHALGRPVIGPASREPELLNDVKRAMASRHDRRPQNCSLSIADAVRALPRRD